jgi:predicted Zn-dependent protease
MEGPRGARSSLFLVALLLLYTLSASALTVEEERRIGKDLYFHILKDSKVASDPVLLIYLHSMKDRLEREASPPFEVKVTLIDSKRVDAFATMGGYIYVTTELMKRCEREDELAAVLAHEMVHVSRRHIAKRIERERKISMALLAAMFASMLAPDTKAKEAILTGTAASYEALSLKYSREDESEADLYGSYILERTGFDPSGLRDFLKRLRVSGEREVPQYLLTHPYVEERIRLLEQMEEKKEKKRAPLFDLLRLRLEVASATEEKQGGAGLSGKPQELYRQALLLEKKGKIDEALRLMNTPDLPPVLRSEFLIKAGRVEEALSLLDEDDFQLSLYFKAICAEAKGKWEEALCLLSKILDVGETCHEVYRRYGILAGRLGREGEGYEYMGRFELLEGRRLQGKRYLEKAVSIYGPNTEKGRRLLEILEGQ